jgi:DNA-binding IclR family transcriptional regulator
MERPNDYSVITAIQRTLAALECLAPARHGLSVTELADTLRLNKATTFRILASLQRMGYVEQDALSQRYRLTLKIASLAFALIDTRGFEDLCQPYLNELAHETGELVQLAVVQDEDMIFIARAEGRHLLRVMPELGRRVTLHASAAGKVWLASLPEEEAARIALRHGLPRLGPRTLTTVDALLREWAAVRQQGYATTVEEYAPDVSSVAAPIRAGTNRQVVAALAVAGPTSRLTEAKLHELAPRLIAAGDAIGRVWPQWPEPAVAGAVGGRGDGVS